MHITNAVKRTVLRGARLCKAQASPRSGLSSRSQVNFIGYQARAAYQPAEADFLPQENA